MFCGYKFFSYISLMKNYKIFLDDVRNPYCIFKLTIIEIFEKNEDWVIVRDYYIISSLTQLINLVYRLTYLSITIYHSIII
jgi:hypothetical protein